jgi:polyphosphate kinase 2 (PPK2 family)
MIERILMQPDTPTAIADRDPRDTLGFAGKDEAEERLEGLHVRLQLLQRRLYAESSRSVLLVLQGLDASGKDGVIGSVLRRVNPQGCRVASFRAPTSTELPHDYLWRVHAALPACGEIGIFNRSHYEDIVTVRI